MRKYNHLLAGLGLAVCIVLGGALPHLLAALRDAYTADHLIPLPDHGSHYVYQGTLSNRVLALSAHLNASPAVQRSDDAPTSAPEELWPSLKTLLPVEGDASAAATAFVLAPRQYSAEYHYRKIVYENDGAWLTVLWDEESALPLRLELRAAPDVLTAFLDAPGNEPWQLLRRYGSLLGLGELADSVAHLSTLTESHSMQVRGAPFTLTLTAMPTQGLLIFKLESQ